MVTPVYIYMVRGLEDASFVEDEIADVARQKAAAARLSGGSTDDSAACAAEGGRATIAGSSGGVTGGMKEHVV